MRPMLDSTRTVVAAGLVAAVLMALGTDPALAQRMSHGGGGGGSRGGGGGSSRPSTASRPSTPSRPSAPSRPSGASSGASSRDSRPSINGGNQRTPDRGGSTAGKVSDKRGGNTSNLNNNDRNSNNRGGNNVNVGSGNKNVNINVDNSRNTTVRRNTNVRYNSPPYRYGGRGYSCYHPYYYHPYRPYYWGPTWHPWGFFIATMAVTAVVVSANNQQYHYDNGVYYAPSGSGYAVVAAPVGATVQTIPTSSQTVVVNNTTNNYYYGGTYYEKGAGGYTVVPPTAGTLIENLPEGAEEVKVGDQTYVKYGETYYSPIQKDGKSMYEVVLVEDDN